MKTLIIAALISISVSCIAKTERTQSYWVIESKADTESTIIRFYDHQNNLIHQETINGKRLSVTKRKHRKLLDQKLKEAELQETIALGQK